MSAPSFNPEKTKEDINWGYNCAAHIRNNLDGPPTDVSTALTELNSRVAQIGASLHSDSAHHSHLQSDYESLRFQAKAITALLKSRSPDSPLQLGDISSAPVVQSALAQALPMGNFVEGSTNQFKYAKHYALLGGHEASTLIAAFAASALLCKSSDSSHEIKSERIDIIIHEGMQRYNQSRELSRGLSADSSGSLGISEVESMSNWELETAESAVHTARLIIGTLHNLNRYWVRTGAIITHRDKTYAVILLNKTIFFFDSQGFSSDEDNAYIAHFTSDIAAVQFLARKMPYQALPPLLSDGEITEQPNMLTINWVAITS